MQIEAGGHGYSTTREIKGLSGILDRTGSVKLVASEAAQNALTHAQEFSWGDIFMTFNYQNKGGKLFANGRPIEAISSMEEVGGDRMGRVIDAMERLTADTNIAESIVVSEDLGYGRHFIYRYRKEESGDIEGLAFEYQGTTEELGQVVKELGKKAINLPTENNLSSIDFSKPLFFTKENKNNEVDLARAADGSFTSGERRRDMKDYLNRLDRDTSQFDQLMQKRKQQEEKLKGQYEKLILEDPDAKTGIANAVYGNLRFVEEMVRREDRHRVGETRVLPTIDLSDSTRVFEKDYQQKAEEMIKPQAKTENQSIKRMIQTTKILVPALVGVFRQIVVSFEEKEKYLPEEKVEKGAQQKGEIYRQKELKDDGRYPDEFMSLKTLFGETEEFFVDESTNSVRIPHDNKRQDLSDRLTTDFVQGLEMFIQMIQSHEEGKLPEGVPETGREKIGKQIVMTEVIDLGDKILELMSADGKKEPAKDQNRKQHSESIPRLSFLLRIYKDKKIPDMVKEIIVALVWNEVARLVEDKAVAKLCPEMEIISKKFIKLLKFTGFLRDKLDTLLFYIYRHEELDISPKIIYFIFAEHINKISFERLPDRNRVAAAQSIYWAKSKKREKTIRHGMIYWFNHELFYQNSSPLVTI